MGNAVPSDCLCTLIEAQKVGHPRGRHGQFSGLDDRVFILRIDLSGPECAVEPVSGRPVQGATAAHDGANASHGLREPISAEGSQRLHRCGLGDLPLLRDLSHGWQSVAVGQLAVDDAAAQLLHHLEIWRCSV